MESNNSTLTDDTAKFVRVSIKTHEKLCTLQRIFTNVYGKHFSHNDTISEMLSLWEAENGRKL